MSRLRNWRSSASSSIATTKATCCRSSPSRWRIAQLCFTRSSSGRAAAVSARVISRRCSKPSNASRLCAEISKTSLSVQPLSPERLRRAAGSSSGLQDEVSERPEHHHDPEKDEQNQAIQLKLVFGDHCCSWSPFQSSRRKKRAKAT